MAEIKLRGRTIPLIYTVCEMKQAQDEICRMEKLQYLLFGQNNEGKYDEKIYGSPEHLDALTKLIRIMGNAGLEEAGEKPDLTDKKIMRAIRPAELLGAIQAMREYNAKLVSMPTDDEGVIVEAAEELIKKHHPKLMYVIPTFQNPTGITLSLERRRALAALASAWATAWFLRISI